jgi:hypothetical protein
MPSRFQGEPSFVLSASIGTMNPLQAPPRGGAPQHSQFPSWEGSGAGLSPPVRGKLTRVTDCQQQRKPCRGRFVAQSCTVSPKIVAAREDFFNHGWTRINTDEDGLSLIRVHPCSSVVGSYWLRLRRAVSYRRLVICVASQQANALLRSDTLPNILKGPWDGRHAVAPAGALECGGKRSVTPLWLAPRGVVPPQSAVAAALCRRTPKPDGAFPPDSSVIRGYSRLSVSASFRRDRAEAGGEGGKICATGWRAKTRNG